MEYISLSKSKDSNFINWYITNTQYEVVNNIYQELKEKLSKGYRCGELKDVILMLIEIFDKDKTFEPKQDFYGRTMLQAIELGYAAYCTANDLYAVRISVDYYIYLKYIDKINGVRLDLTINRGIYYDLNKEIVCYRIQMLTEQEIETMLQSTNGIWKLRRNPNSQYHKILSPEIKINMED